MGEGAGALINSLGRADEEVEACLQAAKAPATRHGSSGTKYTDTSPPCRRPGRVLVGYCCTRVCWNRQA